MKRLLILLGIVLSFGLVGCENIHIAPGIIDVQYKDIRFEGDMIVVDVYITNGTDADYDIEYAEFWLEIPEARAASLGITEVEVCGAGFDFYITVSANDYDKYEIEFPSEFVFYSEEQLEQYEIALDSLELYFWFDE